MTDVEELVAATLNDRANKAPADPRRLADNARTLHGKRRRRRTVGAVVASAAAVTAAVVIPLSVIDGSGGTPAPIGTPTTGAPATPARTQSVAFHGVEIDVPASWSINEERCGTPTADTVLRDVGVVLACLHPRPDGISTVEMRTGSPRWHDDRPVTVRTDAGNGTLQIQGGQIYVPEVRVLLLVQVPDSELRQEITDSIRVLEVDSNGCRMHGGRLEPPPGIPEDAVQPEGPFLIRATVRSVAVCKYAGRWLSASTTLTGEPLEQLRTVVDGLPDGFVRADPKYYLPSVCDEPDESTRFVLHVLDADGSGRTLWARIGVCGELGITDGRNPHALTRELAAALNGPLHTPYSLQGHLIPAR
jgi:hypothetical protein